MRRIYVLLLLGGCISLSSCSDKKDKAAEASKAAIESVNAVQEAQNKAASEQPVVVEGQENEPSPNVEEEVMNVESAAENTPSEESTTTVAATEEVPQVAEQVNNLPEKNVPSSDLAGVSEKLGIVLTADDNAALYQEVASWLGSPYLVAGNDKSGVDCSGFICSVYQTLYDKKLPRRTSEIYDVCKPVSVSEANAGDIVFFRTDSRTDSSPNFAGIYLKDNKFVIVSSSKGVTVANLESSYYKKTFVSIARVQD